MKTAMFPILLAAVGCTPTIVEISDVRAERGEGDDLVIRFTADRNLIEAAQWPWASLFVASQVDPQAKGAAEARDSGQAWAPGGKYKAEDDRLWKVGETPGPEGPRYAFRASFPLRGEGIVTRHEIRLPYDLSRAGVHELEFWTRGNSCGFNPAAFESNRVKLTYRAP